MRAAASTPRSYALSAGRIAVFASVCCAALLTACPDPPSFRQPRLVLLYATCSLNKHFLSSYDRSIAYTPHIEEFSKNALVFERHQTETGQSGTAFASIFSGLQAPDRMAPIGRSGAKTPIGTGLSGLGRLASPLPRDALGALRRRRPRGCDCAGLLVLVVLPQLLEKRE